MRRKKYWVLAVDVCRAREIEGKRVNERNTAHEFYKNIFNNNNKSTVCRESEFAISFRSPGSMQDDDDDHRQPRYVKGEINGHIIPSGRPSPSAGPTNFPERCW